MARHRRAQRLSKPVVAASAAAAVVVGLAAGGLTIALFGGDSDEPSKPSASASVDPNNPLSGLSFYVNPANPAAQQYRQLKADGNTEEAAQLQKIAGRPIAEWLASDNGGTKEEVAQLVADATAAGKTAVMTIYNLPHRDCGQYSSGGVADAAAYRKWIDQIVAGLTGHSAVVVLEPDAIAHTLDGCLGEEARISERYELLKYAITALKANPDVAVYLDAGNASWIKDLSRMVAALKQVGVDQSDGFALNVSNFETTETSVAYGNTLSAELDSAHYVIDTSRNGNGPYTDAADDAKWCNPPGRALGTPPTTTTGIAKVDAFLWVKQPGDSDGACRTGAPEAGQWWPEYALALARESE